MVILLHRGTLNTCKEALSMVIINWGCLSGSVSYLAHNVGKRECSKSVCEKHGTPEWLSTSLQGVFGTRVIGQMLRPARFMITLTTVAQALALIHRACQWWRNADAKPKGQGKWTSFPTLSQTNLSTWAPPWCITCWPNPNAVRHRWLKTCSHHPMWSDTT